MAGMGLGFTLVVSFFLIVLAIAWIILPFALIGTKPLLRELVKEMKVTNALLEGSSVAPREIAESALDSARIGGDAPSAMRRVRDEMRQVERKQAAGAVQAIVITIGIVVVVGIGVSIMMRG